MASSASASASSDAVVCKLILVGNGSVGKTSITNRFKDDGFARVYKQTIGIDFYEKRLRVRGREVVLQVWDIGGQSIGSQMLPGYVSGAAVVFLCYDVTDPQSFSDAEDWHALIQRAARTAAEGSSSSSSSAAAAPEGKGKGGGPLLYLIGNKIDLAHLRKITPEKHAAFVTSRRLDGDFFVSARSGEGVLTAFYSAAARQLGLQLTEAELEQTKKVLGVVVATGNDEARTAFADEIERQDREAQERRAAGEGKGCCTVV